MKQVKAEYEIRSEYKREGIGVGVRRKYYEAYTELYNVVLLEPEIVQTFPRDEFLNKALISLIRLAQTLTGLQKIQFDLQKQRSFRSAQITILYRNNL